MTFNLTNATAVALGGTIGALARFYIYTLVARYFPHEIPIATLSVNIIGSLIIGFLSALFLHYHPSDFLRLFIVTGFLGALTTYSTFALESYMLLNSNSTYAILNIVLNLFGSIGAVMVGFKLVQQFIK